ncbi:MAG: hypothetical protein CMF41_01595 [Legionellales bacterium]|nr:hypothetical protein [Legionellales bacterium]OUX66151.1 MAG: hypothetical protein CBE41_00805 [Gammaproteobacteria bacterium TMED281]
MKANILISFILFFVVLFIYLAHWYDEQLIQKIKSHEADQEKKGILKRHFSQKRVRRRSK